MSDSLWPMDCSLPGFFSPWDFQGKDTGVDCHFLLQGIFQTQGWNLSLLYGQGVSLPLGYQRRPFLYSTWSLLSFWDELFILNNLRTCLSYFLNIFLLFLSFSLLFIYSLILAALGLRCCVQAFSSCCEWGSLLVAVGGLLIAAASLIGSTVAAQGS